MLFFFKDSVLQASFIFIVSQMCFETSAKWTDIHKYASFILCIIHLLSELIQSPFSTSYHV